MPNPADIAHLLRRAGFGGTASQVSTLAAQSWATTVAGVAPVTGFASTPSGKGYWLAATDGTVAAYGDAPKLGRAHAPTAALIRC